MMVCMVTVRLVVAGLEFYVRRSWDEDLKGQERVIYCY